MVDRYVRRRAACPKSPILELATRGQAGLQDTPQPTATEEGSLLSRGALNMEGMEKQNPYQSPPLVEEEAAPIGVGKHEPSVGFEFQSDWSIDGLRRRRRSPLHAQADLGYAVLSVVWLITVMLAFTRSGAAALACPLTPIWFVASLIWISSMAFRHGGNFVKTCGGFAGPVRGRVDAGFVTIVGPAMSLAARTRDCSQPHWKSHGVVFRPPLIMESLPVIESDIEKTWAARTPQKQRSGPSQLMDRLLGATEAGRSIVVPGELRGTDFRRFGCWRRWIAVGVILCLIAVSGFLWAAYRWAHLDPWIVDPPSHYMLTDSEVLAFYVPIMIAIVSTIVLAIGITQWMRTRTRLGEYVVAITPAMVAIATERVALGYSADALDPFELVDNGIAIQDRRGRVVFMIPIRWFDPEDRQQVVQWFSEKPATDRSKPRNVHYLGPTI